MRSYWYSLESTMIKVHSKFSIHYNRLSPLQKFFCYSSCQLLICVLITELLICKDFSTTVEKYIKICLSYIIHKVWILQGLYDSICLFMQSLSERIYIPLLKLWTYLGAIACACPSYWGGCGRRIMWVEKYEVSLDTTAGPCFKIQNNPPPPNKTKLLTKGWFPFYFNC